MASDFSKAEPSPTALEARIGRAVAGSTADMMYLLQLNRTRLLEYIQRILPASLRREMDPDDILQETLTCIVDDLPSFVYQDDESFFKWQIKIARHRCLDEIRKVRTAKRGGRHHRVSRWQGQGDSSPSLTSLLAATSWTASQSVANRETIQSLKDAIACLPSTYRQVIVLHHLEGKPLNIVAEKVGKSANATQKLAAMAVEALRRAMAGPSHA